MMEGHIHQLLRLRLYPNAIQLAETHYAEVNSEDSLYYVALSYFGAGEINSCYKILSKAPISQNQSKSRLLLGQCCYQLEKFHEAEKVLLGDLNQIDKDELVALYENDQVSAAAAAEYLGLIFERTARLMDAGVAFRLSLVLFPYMWRSAEALSRLAQQPPKETTRTNFLSNVLVTCQLNTNENDNHVLSGIITPSNDDYKTPKGPPPVKKGIRRSTRLYPVETPTSRPTFAALNAPAKKVRRVDPEVYLDPVSKIHLERYRALDCLYQYKLDQAIAILNGLPERHKNCGWVLTHIARVYYEKTNYVESIRYYEMARKLEPYRMKGMEYYSSALWHLQKEVELSILAKELMDFNESAPETWVVAGNCYSLQKDHETAIKYLEKAIKVDPNFAYAYTLLGHELISAERLDQALTCFRKAVKLDPRHWNAWCGLGCIHYKNEKYVDAESYYMKALNIAPTNPVLMCQLAIVQHACKQSDTAIDTLTKALSIDPDNALCRFHRATIYSAIDKNREALHELEELKKLVPKESMVYFLMGKIQKKTGNTHTALMNFSWAMELDPKGANNTIRDVIDKQHSGDDDVVVHRD